MILMKPASVATRLTGPAGTRRWQAVPDGDFETDVSPREEALAQRRRAVRIGKDILGLLEDLRLSLDAIDPDDVAESEPADVCLKNVLAEIQLRAQSELAKLDRTLLHPAASARQI
jgi:hypothetical protein